MQEPLAGRDLHPYQRVAVGRIPPVVPYARLDDGSLALMQNAHLVVALDGQLTLEHGEALDKDGMPVFPGDTRPNQRGQLGGRAARRIVPRTLQERSALPGDRILPDLTDLYGSVIWRALWVGVPHATELRIPDVSSAIRE